jgi:hypothetical protein
MSQQFFFNKCRIDYLRNYIKIELEDYLEFLSKTKDKELKQLYKNYCYFEPKLMDKIIKQYLKRCELKHAMAFF